MSARIIHLKNEGDVSISLEHAVDVLRTGGLVAVPTESYYGLAVNAMDEDAITRLLRVKKRERNNPILLLISDILSLEHLAEQVPDISRRLIDQFWPGGLTMVFKAGPMVSPLLTAGSSKIGIRLSSHIVPTELARALGAPITGTSANISGQPPSVRAGDVYKALGNHVDLIIDSGPTAGGKGSTVVDVTQAPPQVLREGMVSRELLERHY